MTRSMYDVILVGGGVMGCATAYHLLRFDNRLRVALIEMDPHLRARLHHTVGW